MHSGRDPVGFYGNLQLSVTKVLTKSGDVKPLHMYNHARGKIMSGTLRKQIGLLLSRGVHFHLTLPESTLATVQETREPQSSKHVVPWCQLNMLLHAGPQSSPTPGRAKSGNQRLPNKFPHGHAQLGSKAWHLLKRFGEKRLGAQARLGKYKCILDFKRLGPNLSPCMGWIFGTPNHDMRR